MLKTKTYTVKKGDTLWSISKKFYGVGSLYYHIAIKNNIDNPDTIEVGDYANGERVINIIKEHEYLEVSDEEIVIDKEDIKSIVTKQQFEAMQYIVRED